MNSKKLAPTFLLIPLALTTLACPTRPIDNSGSGGAAGVAGAPDETGGHAGATAGASGAAGTAAGVAGAAGGTAGAAGAAAGAAGGMAGTSGGMAGAAGGTAGVAGSVAGAAGGAAGAAGGLAGAAGGMTGLGGAAGGSSGLADGQPCSLATNCASHVCTAFYVDGDGDGYGTGQAVGFCGTTAPIGYASQSGDCCDSAPNLAVARLIHPGADFQNTSAGGVCGITWDYNCSGQVEQSVPKLAGCTLYPECSSIPGSFDESLCGQSVKFLGCAPDANSATCDTPSATNSMLLGCK